MRLFIAFSIFLFLFLLGVSSCSKKHQAFMVINRSTLDSLGLALDVSSEEISVNPCNRSENYSPDSSDLTLDKVRTLRLIFHIMNSSDSSQNFSAEKAPNYFWTMLNNAQERINENRKMNLPEGNKTPVFSPGYQYKKVTVPEDEDGDGFLYHYDDEMYYFLNRGRYRNNYKRDIIQKYKVGDDSILNIFVMPHHPDSVASVTYKAHSSGIALGNNIKVAGIYENGGESWRYATLINHEIGHVLGLKHSWIRRDGCDDTPSHNNCYDSFGKSPCDGLASNNMMDYNNSQMAITPCQLGIIHRNFSDLESRQRKLLVEDWCRLDTLESIIITDSINWKGDKDSHHNILIEKGGKLSVYCRLSMPENSSITVMPGGELYLYNTHLHNDCGYKWNGIQLNSEGNERGKVFFHGDIVIEDI